MKVRDVAKQLGRDYRRFFRPAVELLSQFGPGRGVFLFRFASACGLRFALICMFSFLVLVSPCGVGQPLASNNSVGCTCT